MGQQHTFSRREWLQWTACLAATTPLLSLPQGALAADDKDSLQPLNRFPRMTHNYFVQRARRATAKNRERKQSFKTADEVKQYAAEVRKAINDCFGPWPERTPFEPQITGTIERDDYRIEKVIYHSRPQFPVTANLYLPARKGSSGKQEKYPAVLGLCGHSDIAKAYESYQSFAQGLARLGIACLIIDPIGQGERLQYPKGNGKSEYGGSVGEHLQVGNQQYLVGESLASWRAWDGMRGIDYLLSRPDIDGKHLGVTGNSGGGTMTMWVTGIDDRLTMSAPSCAVTSFQQNLENELPTDTEQCPPGVLAAGLEHVDFFVPIAPGRVTLLAQRLDFFDIRGTRNAYQQLRHLNELLGKADHVRLHVGDGGHGIPADARLAMYQTFCAAAGLSVPDAEPTITLEKEQDLYCTPEGQVAKSGVKTVFDFTAEKAKEQAANRKKNPPQGEALAEAIRDVLAMPEMPEKPPGFRILRPYPSRKYPAKAATTFAVVTEPGIFAPVTRLAEESLHAPPPEESNPAILYVSHRSADAELREEPLIKELIKASPDARFYACDLRGIGESEPVIANYNSFLGTYGSDYMHAAHAILLSQSMPGLRTYDLLRVLDWIGSLGHSSIHLVGRGWGAIPATFAAVLSDKVKQVTLKNGLTSFEEVASTADYHWPLSALPLGILKRFDLPDCYTDLKAKQLRQIEPWNATQGMS